MTSRRLGLENTGWRTTRRREDEESPAEAAPRTERRATPAGGPAATILDLQATAGNRSVVAMLAGEGPAGLHTAIQRDATDDAAVAQDSAQGSGSSSSSLTIKELDLVVPLAAFALKDGRRSTRPDAAAGGGTRPKVQEATASIQLADLDARLGVAASTGRQFSEMDVDLGNGLGLKLHDVILGGLQIGSSGATLTLNFQSADFIDTRPTKGAGTP